MRMRSPRARELLLKLLDSEAPSIRALGALGLGMLKDRRAKPQLVAVADVDLCRIVPLQARFPKVRAYQDWRELLEREAAGADAFGKQQRERGFETGHPVGDLRKRRVRAMDRLAIGVVEAIRRVI